MSDVDVRTTGKNSNYSIGTREKNAHDDDAAIVTIVTVSLYVFQHFHCSFRFSSNWF